MFDPKEAAEVRIGWWKEHNSKNYEKVTELLARELEIIHGLEPKIAKEIVVPLVKAGKEHDLAERENISKKESKLHWDKAEEFMTQHFSMLNEALIAKNQAIMAQIGRSMEMRENF